MILVDTPVWIDHIRSRDPILSRMLAEDRVVVHPFVIGEIALGSIRNRPEVLRILHRLPDVVVAFPVEILSFIERYGLHGAGIGYVDTHLLASARLSDGIALWTRDRNLHAAAERLSVAADPSRFA